LTQRCARNLKMRTRVNAYPMQAPPPATLTMRIHGLQEIVSAFKALQKAIDACKFDESPRLCPVGCWRRCSALYCNLTQPLSPLTHLSALATHSAKSGTIPFENFPKEMQEKLRQLDSTGDGQLDAQEILAGIEALQREKDRAAMLKKAVIGLSVFIFFLLILIGLVMGIVLEITRQTGLRYASVFATVFMRLVSLFVGLSLSFPCSCVSLFCPCTVGFVCPTLCRHTGLF